MKTIESFVAEKYHGQRELPKHKQIPASCFIDWANIGAREAQRWITLNEELPETDKESSISDNVLVKVEVLNAIHGNEYTCCIEGFYDADTEMWSFMLPIVNKLKITVVAWRPINRE